MKDAIFTRMGDGELVSMSAGEIKRRYPCRYPGCGRQRAEIPELTTEEMEQLFEIIAEPSRAVSVNCRAGGDRHG